MRKLIAIALVLCILLTVFVSGASAASKENRVSQIRLYTTNYANAAASSTDKPAYITATSYVETGIVNNRIIMISATQASASGNIAYARSGSTLGGCVIIT